MVVPTQCLGNLIGKGGKYFNSIRESCGVELKVDDTPQAYPGNGEPASTVVVKLGMIPLFLTYLTCYCVCG